MTNQDVIQKYVAANRDIADECEKNSQSRSKSDRTSSANSLATMQINAETSPPLDCVNKILTGEKKWLLHRRNVELPVLRMKVKVRSDILRLIGLRSPEQGGMLGGDWVTGEVSEFFFDRGANTSYAEYSPDVASVNRILKLWNSRGIRLMGFVHSHPHGFMRPSGADADYAERLLAHNSELPAFFLPIVQTVTTVSDPQIHAFVAVRDGAGCRVYRTVQR